MCNDVIVDAARNCLALSAGHVGFTFSFTIMSLGM